MTIKLTKKEVLFLHNLISQHIDYVYDDPTDMDLYPGESARDWDKAIIGFCKKIEFDISTYVRENRSDYEIKRIASYIDKNGY